MCQAKILLFLLILSSMNSFMKYYCAGILDALMNRLGIMEIDSII